MASLDVNFLGLRLKNPLVLASGILGTSPSLMARCALEGAGGITSKSCGPAPRTGHSNPVALAWDGGVINAIGLTNPGAKEEVPLLRETKKRLAAMGVPLFASIFAPTVSQFGEVESAAAVTRAVRRAVSLPISIKLAPNVPNIGEIAHAAAEEGADAITAVNTMPVMLIDAHAAKPVLRNKTGGLSGTALKPIALRCVAEIASRVSLPIIGTGGVASGLDAAEMIMAGATLVGVGSAVWQDGPGVFGRIARELQTFVDGEGYDRLKEMRGKAIR